MIRQYWFRWWLGAVRQRAIKWANVDLVLCHNIASLRPNELTVLRSCHCYYKPKQAIEQKSSCHWFDMLWSSYSATVMTYALSSRNFMYFLSNACVSAAIHFQRTMERHMKMTLNTDFTCNLHDLNSTNVLMQDTWYQVKQSTWRNAT